MEPNIIEEKVISLLGCVYYGNPFLRAAEWDSENEVGKLWNRFMGLVQRYSALLSKINLNPMVGYEVHIEPEEYEKTQNYYVFVGIEVEDLTEIPMEMFVKILPKVTYLTFTTKVHDNTPVEYYLKEWIPQNEYEQAYPFIIETYDGRRYKGMNDKESEIDWLIPIKKI